MEDEWEEEEQLVVVELSGIINNDFLSKCGGTCKIVGIDSERPVMQVGQYVFAGEYERALGTCVLFEESQQKGPADDEPELKYKCHTVNKLMMQRVFLTEKKEGETCTGSGDGVEQEDQTCQSNQEENDNHRGVTEEEMDRTDMKDSVMG